MKIKNIDGYISQFPADVQAIFAAGNPCRVIREIIEKGQDLR